MTHRTDFGAMECPVARSLDCVGEWWSILILRDAYQGATKFDEFQKNLGIAPNMLARRLKHLTANGMFETRLYSQRPPRQEYVLTKKACDFFPVLVTMLGWGNKYLAPQGASLEIADRETLVPFEPNVVNAAGQSVSLENVVLVAGPAASEMMHKRLATVKALRPDRPIKQDQ
jgi:DNA-binding HxlR family transcriptional regulator